MRQPIGQAEIHRIFATDRRGIVAKLLDQPLSSVQRPRLSPFALPSHSSPLSL